MSTRYYNSNIDDINVKFRYIYSYNSMIVNKD